MKSPRRVLLVNLYPLHLTSQQIDEDATEMYNLAISLGDVAVMDMVHQRGKPVGATYIGYGKTEEVIEKIKEYAIEIVILSGIAKPNQLYELWQILSKDQPKILVWDRVDLILQIFSAHAHTSEAKLQIELANMRHMGPRIYGMGHVLSQQGGGIGARGIGETNVELMKRHWKEAMRHIKKQLDHLQTQHLHQIEKRQESGLPTVSVVGYTNAGKTTLFNRLTRKGKYADDKLFATLDSTVGKVYLPEVKQEVFVSDTIGFVKNLPPDLIDAFRSTLLETIHADVILHVVDASSPTLIDQVFVVSEILSELASNNKKVILVLNKIDAITPEEQETVKMRLSSHAPIAISAQTGQGIDQLLATIAHHIP